MQIPKITIVFLFIVSMSAREPSNAKLKRNTQSPKESLDEGNPWGEHSPIYSDSKEKNHRFIGEKS